MRLPIIRREEREVDSRPIRSLIDDFLDNAFFESDLSETKMMSIDVIEREQEFLLSANLPGIKKQDIKVYVEGDSLVIEAKRQEEKEDKNETMYRCERYQGDYRRVFSVPENWDYENIKAKYEDGVLKLTVPKKEIKPEKEIMIK